MFSKLYRTHLPRLPPLLIFVVLPSLFVLAFPLSWSHRLFLLLIKHPPTNLQGRRVAVCLTMECPPPIKACPLSDVYPLFLANKHSSLRWIINIGYV